MIRSSLLRPLQPLLPVALVAAAAITGCLVAGLAMAQAPDGGARQPAAVQADQQFLDTFHRGDYAHLQEALESETVAYLRNPNDAQTAAHVGWLHMWRASERSRLEHTPATITDDLVLARKYFARAAALDPEDARFRGFLASAMLAEAQIDRDDVLRQQGAAVMQQAVKDWPAFNLFTAGYVASNQPADSEGFRQALELQWKNLEVCAHTTLDRRGADLDRFASAVHGATTGTRDARACLNSATAPHNEEGFILNMGDMLTKAGDWETARKVYALARRSPDYAQWPYREVLEQRIRDAQVNVATFNRPVVPGQKPATTIMLGSAFSCTACHQH
ncbi:hypothetical protein DVT68_09340 [Dyella solisilvae]|uniref:DUF4034 domain-containing protein n=1 Tax=Dyella solisilvae TaxID=1920168 RepID=A0A370K7U1_9GAMM|nr:hypothetical protein [Dyella solisilvae]RDI98712.1 hypothetical protein DVT68_09340 [Dyella solisilvae]